MKCPFYKYYHGDYCTITQKNTNRDIYRSYCSVYSYDKCPIYIDNKKSSSSGFCYLTTACVEMRGLPDDCHELTALRALRDNYIRTLPEGESVISDYYKYAPQIVEKIKQSSSPDAVFEKIYTEMIIPCVHLVDIKKYHEAYLLYKKCTEDLKMIYARI